MQPANNHVPITGGTSGTGFALAEAFLKAGSRDFPELNVLVNNAGIQRDIDFKQG